MIERILLASAHLLALGIGLGAVWARGRALRIAAVDEGALQRAFVADNFWGGAALLWIASGLTRAFGGFEKGSYYYLHNNFFWIKMSLFVVIFALDLRPMIALIRWRIRLKKHEPLDLRSARSYGFISHIQAGLLVVMVGVACSLARGCA